MLIAFIFVLFPFLKHSSLIRNRNVKNFFLHYKSRGSIIILLLIIFIPLFSLIFYSYNGFHQSLFHFCKLQKEAKIAQAELKRIKNPQKIIEKLQQYLQSHPNKPRGWYLLGRFYLGEHQYFKAYQALDKAFHLKPNQLTYTIAYAEADFFYHKQNLSPENLQNLKKIVRQHPNQVSAINLLAINAYQQQKYRLAIHYWEKLLPLFATQSRDEQRLLMMINQAQQHLHSTSIVIKVMIAARFKPLLKSSDIVYVYALVNDGSSMPIAVVRKQASHLPFYVTLGAKTSMLPGRTLRVGEKVKLVARVSKTGSPLPKLGDLTSTAKYFIMKASQNRTHLFINHIIK